MAENESVERASNTVVAILYVSVFLGVLLLAVVIVIGAMNNANTDINGIQLSTSTVTNETGYANSSGYTVTYASTATFQSPVITAVFNRTAGTSVPTTNISISSVGLVTNATAVTYDNLSISYTYQIDVSNSTGVNLGYAGMQTNILSMVGNFFALMPTIGTILAVVILIVGIVMLVLYVRRMKDSGSQEQTFSG